jgi:hypothetical protein
VYNLRRGEVVLREHLGVGLNTRAQIYRENLVSLTTKATCITRPDVQARVVWR